MIVFILIQGLKHFIYWLLFSLLLIFTLSKLISLALVIYAQQYPLAFKQHINQLSPFAVDFQAVDFSWQGISPRIRIQSLQLGPKPALSLGDVDIRFSFSALWRSPAQLPLVLSFHHTYLPIRRNTEGEWYLAGLKLPLSQHGSRLPARIEAHQIRLSIADAIQQIEFELHGVDLNILNRLPQPIELRLAAPSLQLLAELEPQAQNYRLWFKLNDFDLEPWLSPYLAQPVHHQLPIQIQIWADIQAKQLKKMRGLFDLDQEGIQLDLSYQDSLWQARLSQTWQQPTDLKAIWGDQGLAISVHQIALQSWFNWEWLFPVSWQKKLSRLRPEGQIQNIYALWSQGWQWWQADLQNLSWQADANLPGIKYLHAHIRAQPHSFNFDIHSPFLRLQAPAWFRQPLNLDIQGQLKLNWPSAQQWQISAESLRINSPHIRTLNQFELSRQGNQPLHLVLIGEFKDGQGQFAPLYYPIKIIKPRLLKWLDQAFIIGHIPEGRYLYAGPLSKKSFPFDQSHDGHFEVWFKTEDFSLNYHPDWPPIHKVAATVHFWNNSLRIEAQQAELYRQRLKKAWIRIDPLKKARWVDIEGWVQGELADHLRLISESPLQRFIGAYIKDLDFNGPARLQFKLKVPLRRGEKVAFQGKLRFLPGAALHLKKIGLRLKQLQGEVELGLKYIRAQALKAQTLGGHTQFDLSFASNGGLKVKGQGVFQGQALAQWQPRLQILQPQGQSHFNYQIQLKNQLQFHIQSDLKGMQLHLPADLGQHHLVYERQGERTQIQYGNLDLSFDQQQLRARFKQLRLADWLAWWPDSSSQAASWRRIVLDIDNLQTDWFTARPFKLYWQKLPADDWQARLQSPQITGIIVKKQSRFFIHLDRLRLNQWSASSPTQIKLPDLDLMIRQWTWQDYDLGQLQFHSQNGQIQSLLLKGKDLELQLKRQRQSLIGEASSPDFGALLKGLGLFQGLTGGQLKLKLQLLDVAAGLKDLSAWLQFELLRVQFTEFKNNWSKLLGLINLSALPRRLSRDFKDITEKGLVFDRISADMRLQQGRLQVRHLEMDSPSLMVLIQGQSDLITRHHDQSIIIIPRLDAALPLAGLAIGGLPGGLIALLLQQWLAQHPETIPHFQYHLSGPWQKPQLELQP